MPRHRFITTAYGHLVPSAHRFHDANAGHGPVLLHVRAEPAQVYPLTEDEARGCPLGIVREPYRACTPIDLAPGDLLILGSDGLVETRRRDECFGTERLGRFLLAGRAWPVQDLLDGLFAETMAFHERPQPNDDLTLLLVRRRPAVPAPWEAAPC